MDTPRWEFTHKGCATQSPGWVSRVEYGEVAVGKVYLTLHQDLGLNLTLGAAHGTYRRTHGVSPSC